MRQHLLQPKDRILEKVQNLSRKFIQKLIDHLGKNISKNLSRKFIQKLIDHAEQSAEDMLKTALKRAIQKAAEATADLIGNRIVDKITRDSKTSPKNNSDTNE